MKKRGSPIILSYLLEGKPKNFQKDEDRPLREFTRLNSNCFTRIKDRLPIKERTTHLLLKNAGSEVKAHLLAGSCQI